MTSLTHWTLVLLLSCIGCVTHAKECVVWTYVQVVNDDGTMTTLSGTPPNATVVVVQPGTAASFIFESNGIGECMWTRCQLTRDGVVVYDAPLNLSTWPSTNTYMLTEEGTYVPSVYGGGALGGYPVAGFEPVIVTHEPTVPTFSLDVKVWLGGAYDTTTGLMTDHLRVQGLIPVTYSGLTIPTSVLAVTGANAIVDRITVFLRRNGTNVWMLNGVVQRDGDIVNMDGTSLMSVTLPTGAYEVLVSHRNHLDCLSAPITFTTPTVQVDFRSPALSTWGTDARKAIGATRVLWPGDATTYSYYSQSIKYTGVGNDRDAVLLRIGGAGPTATVTGYYQEDVNLDGMVKYTGQGNDRDIILQSVGGTTPNGVIAQQTP